MPRPLVVAAVFGTRPDAIKMAPVVLALRAQPDRFRPVVIVTAQHREMLDQVLAVFGIAPDHDLDVMLPRQSLAAITTRTLERLDAAIGEARPDLMLVQGDAAPSFIGSLAAFYHRIPVGHVEAGLRTDDKYQPFPEEMYRRMTSVLADLHFAPTAWARGNLLREGVPAERILVTGNTVIDALQWVVANHPADPAAAVPGLDPDRRVILVTCHRRENWGEPMRQACLAMRDLVERFDDLELVFAVHRNPIVREVVYGVLAGVPRVHLIEPLDYGPLVHLLRRATLILTDSGGIQEEAPGVGTPVLVLRNTTERPEGVEAGTVRLVGTGRERIASEASRLLTDPEAHRRMSTAVNPYGDGRAAARIVGAIAHHFGLSAERPAEYAPVTSPAH